MYKLIQKLEMRNDNKNDLLIIGLYLFCLLISVLAAVLLFFFEPGTALGATLENVIYVLKIALIAGLGFGVLYDIIKIVSTIVTVIKRERR